MSDPRNTSVMQYKAVPTVYADLISEVNERGEYLCGIKIADSGSLGVLNSRESTNVVKINLPDADYKQKTALHCAANELNNFNSKFFHVLPNPAAAKTLLGALHESDASYSDKILNRDSLFCALLDEVKDEAKEDQTTDEDYTIEIVDPNNLEQCAEVSRFQQDNLPHFRKLDKEKMDGKILERYALDAVIARATSPEIAIFLVRVKGKINGTLTLNRHKTADESVLDRFGYLSDLFLLPGLDDNARFTTKFIRDVFLRIKALYLSIKVLAVMAGTNDLSKPILKCFMYAEKAKLISYFTRAKQEELAIVAQFTYNKELIGKLLPEFSGPETALLAGSMFARARAQDVSKNEPELLLGQRNACS